MVIGKLLNNGVVVGGVITTDVRMYVLDKVNYDYNESINYYMCGGDVEEDNDNVEKVESLEDFKASIRRVEDASGPEHHVTVCVDVNNSCDVDKTLKEISCFLNCVYYRGKDDLIKTRRIVVDDGFGFPLLYIKDAYMSDDSFGSVRVATAVYSEFPELDKYVFVLDDLNSFEMLDNGYEFKVDGEELSDDYDGIDIGAPCEDYETTVKKAKEELENWAKSKNPEVEVIYLEGTKDYDLARDLRHYIMDQIKDIDNEHTMLELVERNICIFEPYIK